ncbi:DUF5919 domain-containing protein [Nocardia rhamnosiphila]
MATLLKALLRQRHLQTVAAFNREYDRLARKIDPAIVGCGPKKAQFYRWLSGDIGGLPYPHHRRVLQEMFPEWSIEELFGRHPDNQPVHDRRHGVSRQVALQPVRQQAGEVEAVYRNRADFVRDMPPQQIFRSAHTIDMVGISLNLLCQQCSDTDVIQLLESGTEIRCLFLDPAGDSIRAREAEEGHAPDTLSDLTSLNIRTLERIIGRTRLSMPGSILIRTFDESPRFNLAIIDTELCVMQPYLPQGRGVESPTFVMRKSGESAVFDTFAGVFDTLWTRGKGIDPWMTSARS